MTHQNPPQPLFNLGQTVATPGALDVLQQADISPASLLLRHQCGDWGDLCEEDKAENNTALSHGYRILSSYQLPGQLKIWVITEADRSLTTLLLPREY